MIRYAHRRYYCKCGCPRRAFFSRLAAAAHFYLRMHLGADREARSLHRSCCPRRGDLQSCSLVARTSERIAEQSCYLAGHCLPGIFPPRYVHTFARAGAEFRESASVRALMAAVHFLLFVMLV